MHTGLKMAPIAGLCLGVLAGEGRAGGWDLRAGPVYRGGMKLSVHGDPAALTPGTQNGAVSAPRGSLTVQDDITEVANRKFDDGFVFLDPSTAVNGDTWYWGYEKGDQWQKESGKLVFQRTLRSVSRGTDSSMTVGLPADVSKTADAAGLGVEASYRVTENTRWRVRFDMGMAGLWLRQSHLNYQEPISTVRSGTTLTASRTATYTYDLMGVIPRAPGDPGTYDGPGPLLPNRPEKVTYGPVRTSSRSLGPGAAATGSGNRIGVDVDGGVYELWVGPSVDWRWTRRLSSFLSPRVSVNVVDLEAERRTETAGGGATLPQPTRRQRESSWRAGAGVHAGLKLALSPAWAVGLEGGYDWLADDGEVSLDPGKVALDASGYTAGAFVGRRW
jgi:opacity protein-like surface antigen